MLGAIAGDVIGSVHEWTRTKTKDFPLFVAKSTFTDDSVLTFAVADWITSRRDDSGLVNLLQEYTHAYPGRGYGGMYKRWARARLRDPYNSYGNGAAMRASPAGWAFPTLDDTLAWAERSAAITHNHPEGIKGAQATAAAIFWARTGQDKAAIRREIESRFGYDLSQSVDAIRPTYEFDESCQGTVPQAIVAFLDSTSYEDAIRNAISLGGDADTLACITGGIAEAYYGGVPRHIADDVLARLDDRLRSVLNRFRTQTTPIAIRRLDEADPIEDLTKLLYRAYSELGAMGLQYAATHGDPAITRDRLKGAECFVATLDSTIVGTIMLRPPRTRTSRSQWYQRPDVAAVGQFGVEPRLQRHGVGRRLFDHAEQRARQLGARDIALDTSEQAAHLIALYERWGFRIVETVQWDTTNYRSVIMSRPVREL